MEFIRDVDVHIAVDSNKTTYKLDLEGTTIDEAKAEIEKFLDLFAGGHSEKATKCGGHCGEDQPGVTIHCYESCCHDGW